MTETPTSSTGDGMAFLSDGPSLSPTEADTSRVLGVHKVFDSTEGLLTESSKSSFASGPEDSLQLAQQAAQSPHHFVATSVSSSLGQGEVTSESSDRGPGTAQAARNMQQATAVTREPDAVDGRTVLEQVQALHARGECAPCSFFMKKAGCTNGDLCRHCHVCKKKSKPRLGKNQRLRYIRMADGILQSYEQSAEQAPATEQLHPFLVSLLRKRGVPVVGGASATDAEQEDDESHDAPPSASKLSL